MTGCSENKIVTLDLRGLLCPIPVLRTAERVASGHAGEHLVLCTDPGIREDLPIWARMHGRTIERIEDARGLLRVRLTIGGGHP